MVLFVTFYGLLIGVTGCIVVPIPANRYVLTERTNVTPQTVKLLGSTNVTREQVLLRLGEPDQVSSEEREFRFHTKRITWDVYWIVVAPYVADGGDFEVTRFYDLVLRFDERGNLTRGTWLEGGTPQGLRPKVTWTPAGISTNAPP